MTGRHEAPPLGSAAREATAAPWHGRHRLDDDPDRCPSCGHPYDGDCGCSCCYDDHQGGPDDV